MLFLTYWELNENMSVKERQDAVDQVMSKKLFPPENVEIIRWDVTPDGWGIMLTEADSVSAISHAVYLWRAAGAGFFKSTKTAPVEPAQDAITRTRDLIKLFS